MIDKGYARIKRTMEIDRLRTFARIEEYEDGGPIIDMMTGREPHTVGQKTCVKAGMWALPWESQKAELPMIELCEVATPVKTMMSQPHELFMKVTGEPREWMYRPDLRLSVDPDFADMVLGGMPFVDAVLAWKPGKRVGRSTTLIVEIKDDEDPRRGEPQYELKLDFARQVYESINWRFVTVVRSRDIEGAGIERAVHAVFLDHDTSISPSDITLCREILMNGIVELGALRPRLGQGHSGVAKAAALHVRRIISLDLAEGLSDQTMVRKVPDAMAIFEKPGLLQW